MENRNVSDFNGLYMNGCMDHALMPAITHLASAVMRFDGSGDQLARRSRDQGWGPGGPRPARLPAFDGSLPCSETSRKIGASRSQISADFLRNSATRLIC